MLELTKRLTHHSRAPIGSPASIGKCVKLDQQSDGYFNLRIEFFALSIYSLAQH
jgi:hypothetical protein